MRKLYAIRDTVANDLAGFNPIVCLRTDQQAVRYFHDVASNKDGAVGMHPEDYEVVCCGLVDDEGNISPHLPPIVVLTGAAWSAQQLHQQETSPADLQLR